MLIVLITRSYLPRIGFKPTAKQRTSEILLTNKSLTPRRRVNTAAEAGGTRVRFPTPPMFPFVPH